jgi:hypothetical protein
LAARCPWTNGNNDGNGIETGRSFNLGNGGRIFVKFSVDGAGKYLAVTSWMSRQMTPKLLSTHHSWAGSVVVPDRTWLYAQAVIQPDGNYTLKLSTQGYDGAPLYEGNGNTPVHGIQLRLEFADNYGGNDASMTLGEAKVCPN